jgi:FKBP-type peptidyl-prolyl cis-trans isomerase FkpA
MPVGSEFEFRIPPALAYGDQALPGIPAGSTLIFKVELFGIK